MKKILLIFTTLMVTSLYSAGGIDILYQTNLQNLPEGYRIENCGIYGISSFDFADGAIYLQNFDSRDIYEATQNGFTKSSREKLKSPYFGNSMDEQGYPVARFRVNNNLSSEDLAAISYERVPERNIIRFIDKGGVVCEIQNSDYVNLIGITSAGEKIFLSEKIKNDVPMDVSREIVVFDNTGRLVNSFEIPLLKYFYLENEFIINNEDQLLQIVVTDLSLFIIRYDNYLENKNYNFDFAGTKKIHYNDFVTTREFQPAAPAKILPAANRLYAVKLGEKHAELKYNCSTANLAYSNTQAPDGDVVRTPGWLFEGVNARIPYKWGGFQSTAQFLNGLASGKYAGDINTQGVSGYAVGNDCSGFVSRCWQLNEHYSTSMMPGITGVHSSWDEIVMGDAIHKVGHVRLYLNRTENGALRVVEAAGRNWDVSYWSFAPSDLTSYSPRYYVMMTATVNENFVKLNSVKYINETTVQMHVTPQVESLGYKVYISENGITWSLHSDEISNTTEDIELTVDKTALYFRVAAVNEQNGSNVEGFWSNIAAASYKDAISRALIVDGFSRNYGSGNWQGYIHNFMKVYSDFLIQQELNLECVSSTALTDSAFSLSDYDYIYWIMGDESTVDETFNSAEQQLLEIYLQNGGNLFVSGSEIGWDLYEMGSDSDRAFYTNYLKAEYIEDDAETSTVIGNESNFLNEITFHIGQTYTEDYPDNIQPKGGSEQIMRYDNGKGAGISYKGTFGSSPETSHVIYLGFPLESTANDEQFAKVMEQSFRFFNDDIVSVKSNPNLPESFELYANYPNPFNPATTLSFFVPEQSEVKINIYNITGQLVSTLFDGELNTGTHRFVFEANNISSGIYFANFIINDKLHVQKLTLLK